MSSSSGSSNNKDKPYTGCIGLCLDLYLDMVGHDGQDIAMVILEGPS